MKINEVLEAYNKAIDCLREEKSIADKGHLIAVEDVKKSMGPYKQFYVSILYHNGTSKVNYPVAGAQLMERCPAGTEEQALERCELAALSKFFQYCTDQEILNSIVNNTYDRIKG